MNRTTATVGAGVCVAALGFGLVALANAPTPSAAGHSNNLEASCDGWSATAYIYPEGSTATVVVDGGEPIVLLPGNGSGSGVWDPAEEHTVVLTIDSSDDLAEGTWSETSTPCVEPTHPETTEVTPSTNAPTTTAAATTTTVAPATTTTSPTATTTTVVGETTTTTPRVDATSTTIDVVAENPPATIVVCRDGAEIEIHPDDRLTTDSDDLDNCGVVAATPTPVAGELPSTR